MKNCQSLEKNVGKLTRAVKRDVLAGGVGADGADLCWPVVRRTGI